MEKSTITIDNSKFLSYHTIMKQKDFEQKNVCLFSPSRQNAEADEQFNVINVVYETEHRKTNFKINTAFKLITVIKGKGQYVTQSEQKAIKKGDFFIIFPGVTQKILNVDNLEYAYVSFMSVKAYNLLGNYGITKNNFYHVNSSSFIKLWKEAFAKKVSLSLYGEGLINITLSYINPSETETPNKENVAAEILFETFDKRFREPSFNLNLLAAELNYSPNYLSAIVKKYTGQSFSAYLSYRRLQKALGYIHSGNTHVKQIAFLCGFADPLYFSKAFKKYTSYSPTEYIEKIANKKISEEQ